MKYIISLIALLLSTQTVGQVVKKEVICDCILELSLLVGMPNYIETQEEIESFVVSDDYKIEIQETGRTKAEAIGKAYRTCVTRSKPDQRSFYNGISFIKSFQCKGYEE